MRATRTLDEITALVLHHQGPGRRALTVAEVDALHRTPNHFGPGVVPRNPGPQYHFAIHAEAGAWTVQQLQPLTSILMHAPGGNTTGIAVIVLCGDLQVLPLPDPARALLLGLAESFLLDPALPNLTKPSRVLGHGEVTPGRSCPGAHMNTEALRDALWRRVPVIPALTLEPEVSP